MKHIIIFIIVNFILAKSFAQEMISDTSANGSYIIHKDERVDMLGRKMAEYNNSLSYKTQIVDGYRLSVINTTDRVAAMNLRTTLLQQFPDQKIYMAFVSPYIKIKVGNFINKEEAEKFKIQILGMNIVPGNIYVMPEKIEIKPAVKTTTEE